MATIYVTLEQAIAIHRNTVEVSGGGALGQIDLGTLESVLQHIQNDDYYPVFEKKLTHLFFCACKFHCFQDGNKRIAIALCAQMLLLNGYLRSISGFIRESENISYHVAAGSISKISRLNPGVGRKEGPLDGGFPGAKIRGRSLLPVILCAKRRCRM